MDTNKVNLIWPSINDSDSFDDSFYRIISIITGIDEITDVEVSFFLDAFPFIFDLTRYEGMSGRLLKYFSSSPFPPDMDVLIDLSTLLEERQNAPTMSSSLFKIVCDFGILDIYTDCHILNLAEILPILNMELMNIHRGISSEVESIINSTSVVPYLSPQDIDFLKKMNLPTLSTFFTIASCHIADRSEIKPKWATRWIDDTSHILRSNIRALLESSDPVFPRDFDLDSIINHYGIVYPYSSRQELIHFYERVQNGTNIFVVLPNCIKKPENENLYFSLEPVENVSEILIGVGNFNSFMVTTLSEIAEVWEHGLKTQQEFFQSPFQVEPMNHEHVRSIMEIARYIGHDDIIRSHREMSEFIRISHTIEGQMVRKYKSLVSNDQSLIRKVVKQIFLTGMYMRRWSGKGPYPLEKHETTDNEVPYYDIIEFSINEGLDEEYNEDNDMVLAKVAKEILYLKSLYEKLSEEGKNIIHRINTYDVESRRSENTPFWENLGKRAMENDYCIRMASSAWIGSSAKFFQLIGKDAKFLDGFDMSRVEHIM